MKIGDLVIRIWCGKPMFDMIGIIVDKKYYNNPLELGDGEWKYQISWCENVHTNNAGQWIEIEEQLWQKNEIEVISECW